MGGRTVAGTPAPQKPTQAAVIFLLSALWLVIVLVISRAAGALVPAMWTGVVRSLGTALFLAAGYHLLAVAFVHDLRPLSAIGFVKRPGSTREFGLGGALGWGIGLALVLPAVVAGRYGVSLDFAPETLARTLLGLVQLAAFAVAVQLVLCGLPMRMLERAIGAGWASTVMVLLALALGLADVTGEGSNIFALVLAVRMFSVAFLRTRAIWLPLGLQLGWTVGLTMLFGATSPWLPPTTSVINATTSGPRWLTGVPYGPEASGIAVLVLIAANIVLYRLTRDYAWHYTYASAEGAGIPVTMAPPAAHVAEEQRAAAAAPPLVQILPSMPANPPDEK